ncbi:MAG: SIR2 family protein [Fibrobacter sp.]|nr:SIR2 family protein [Fibrobacter sp.]
MSEKLIELFPKPLLTDLIAGRWLPVIGAGLSRNAINTTEKELPMWDELGRIFSGELQDYSYTNPIDAISAYEHEYGRPKLIEKLTEALLIHECRPGDAHKAFCKIPFDLVCTTNFDFLLERQYEITPRSCTPLIDEDQLSIGIRSTSVALLKFHGDLNHPKRMVATEKDYDRFLDQFPLLATFVSNLLITRTAVLIGYSLDDPDFRQLWQVINDRLGSSRRVAYVILVGAKPADIARFDRRGVKVINLPGQKNRYGQILAEAFTEIGEYWRDNVIPASQIKDERSLQQLSLPRSAQTRLCFFSIPLKLQSIYRERIFPIVIEAGFIPMTADDVVTPGENWMAKIEAIIERSNLLVVDASTQSTKFELKLAQTKLEENRVLVIVDKSDQLQSELLKVQTVVRADASDFENSIFIGKIRDWFMDAANRFSNSLIDEPSRLLAVKEYRAAVISAISILEIFFREKVLITADVGRRPLQMRQMIEIAMQNGQLGNISSKEVFHWVDIRNQAVHTQKQVTKIEAEKIIKGILSILKTNEWPKKW